MPPTMTAILETRCGCKQEMQIARPASMYIRVAMHNDLKINSPECFPVDAMIRFRQFTFREIIDSKTVRYVEDWPEE